MLIEDDVALELPHASQRHVSPDSKRVPSDAMSMLQSSILLDKILADTMDNLYNASTVKMTWAKIQNHVSQLNSRLENWRSQIISTYGFDLDRWGEMSPLPERMYLALRYFSTGMIINRPCLCEANSHQNAIPDQSESSVDEDEKASALCVASARGLLRLFPQDPDIVWLFQSTPWWCVLHYIVQAGAVLVLEITFNAVHVSDALSQLVADAQKMLRWLSKVAETGLPARRAWVAISRLLMFSLLRIGQDPSELEAFMALDVLSSEERMDDDSFGSNHAKAGPAFRPQEYYPSPFISSTSDSAPSRSSQVLTPTGYAPVFPIYNVWDSLGHVSSHPWYSTTNSYQAGMDQTTTGTDHGSPTTKHAR